MKMDHSIVHDPCGFLR